VGISVARETVSSVVWQVRCDGCGLVRVLGRGNGTADEKACAVGYVRRWRTWHTRWLCPRCVDAERRR
jgi:hypothetical protein